MRARSNKGYSPVTPRRQPPSPSGSPKHPRSRSSACRVGAVFGAVFGVLLLLVGTNALSTNQLTPGAGLQPPPLKAVQLFKKPDVATGQLVAVKEGLDVLRAQKEPFSIISAVGPTRTGKSSILGRAFMRGPHENLFEIGGGVQSYTGGVWITSSPVTLHPRNGGPAIRYARQGLNP